MRARSNRELDEYQFRVRPLSADEGGGYLVEYPDIPGCMSDGETIKEAIANGREAIAILPVCGAIKLLFCSWAFECA